MEAEGFIGQEGKLGLARLNLKNSREFFKGDFAGDTECRAQKIQSLLWECMKLLGC